MTGKDAVKIALTATQKMLTWYLSDLSDEDLLVRPVPTANHLAWQLGHLILAERLMVGHSVPGTSYPELPAGFAEQHHKKMAAVDPPKGFATKAEYVNLFDQTRVATLGNLEKMSDADLDKPISGDMARFAPTVGALFLLQSNHTLLHGGQFTVVRRKLGKPVLF
jgi:hypothetical protein